MPQHDLNSVQKRQQNCNDSLTFADESAKVASVMWRTSLAAGAEYEKA
jgi:hypothetical protein